jgi:hypothetical protein
VRSPTRPGRARDLASARGRSSQGAPGPRFSRRHRPRPGPTSHPPPVMGGV